MRCWCRRFRGPIPCPAYVLPPLSRRMIPLVVHMEAPGRLPMKSRRLAIVTVALALAGLFASAASAQSTLETGKKRGKLIAGVKTDFPPFGTVDAAGKNARFDVDVAHPVPRARFDHEPAGRLGAVTPGNRTP